MERQILVRVDRHPPVIVSCLWPSSSRRNLATFVSLLRSRFPAFPGRPSDVRPSFADPLPSLRLLCFSTDPKCLRRLPAGPTGVSHPSVGGVLAASLARLRRPMTEYRHSFCWTLNVPVQTDLVIGTDRKKTPMADINHRFESSLNNQ